MRVLLAILVSSLFAATAPPAAALETAAARQAAAQPSSQADADLAEAARQHALAVQLFNAKKYDEAAAAAERAVELREKAVGQEHYLTRTSLSNLGEILLAKHDYAGSLKVFRRLLSIEEKMQKPGTDETVKTLERVALLSSVLNKLDDAESAYKRALKMREGSAPDSPLTAHALFRLATFYHLSGRGEQAKPLYARAVSIWEKDAGGYAGEYIEALERYACLLRGKDNSRADELDLRAQAMINRANEKTLASVAPDSDTEVHGGVLNGRAISKQQPAYPREALEARAQGAVVVNVTVDETGRVILACALSGNPLLRDASVRAAYGWRFTPTLLSGVPVKVNGTITFNFTLQ